MVIAAQTPMMEAHRRGQSSLLVVGGLGLLMLVFLAVAPWILRNYNYAVFVPAIAALWRHHDRGHDPCTFLAGAMGT